MYIKAVVLEYDDLIKGDRRTSSVLPLGHPLCQIYEPYEWSKRSSFVYKTDFEGEIWNIEIELRHVLDSWRYLFPGRIRYEIWQCDVTDTFPIIQKNKIYILKACYLIDMMEQDYRKDEILQATEAHISSQGRKKLKIKDPNYCSEYIDIGKHIYIDIRKSRGFISPECYHFAKNIKLMTIKIEGNI